MKPIFKHYILLTSALVLLLHVSKVEAQALTPYTNKAGFLSIVSTTCTKTVIETACLGTDNRVLIDTPADTKIHGRWPDTYVNGPGVDAYILTYYNISSYNVELELNDGTFTPPVTVVANKQHTTSSSISIRYFTCTNGSGINSNTSSYYADVEFENFAIPVGKRVTGARVNLNPVVELADFAKFIVTTNSITCTGANTTAPTIPVTTITASCPGNTFNLNSLVTSTTPSSFFLRWYTNATATGAAIANPTAVNVSGTYYAFYVDSANTCFSPASAAVTGIANCPINLTNTCTSNSVDLASSLTSTTPLGYSVTYHSGTPATAENQLPSSIVTTSGTYYGAYYFAAQNCFTATGRPLVVTINNLSANAGENVSITCTSNTSGATIGAAELSGVTYLWSPATGLSSVTAANPTANPTVTTEYTVTATNTVSGCNATDKVVVTVDKTVPVANAGANFEKTCTLNPSGATIGAAAVAEVTHLWSPAAGLSSVTAANPTANPTVTTEYTVTATNNASGCNATDKVLVTVNTTAPTTPLPTKTSIDNFCPATSVDLNSLVSNTTNLKWYTDSARTTEVTNPSAVTAGTYYPFYVSPVNGCYSSPVSTPVTATISICCIATTAPNLNN